MNRSLDDTPGSSDEDEAFSGLPIPAKGSLLLGKYRVEGVVGVGGMGMVIAARHEHLNERVALKILLPTYANVAETRKRFQREAQAAYKLRSEHVCRVLDAGDLEDGTPFIAMEFLKGDDLAVLLRKNKRYPMTEAVDYLLQACEALGEAHANDIVHRDLKPANLVIITRKDGTHSLKVIDFGISKVSSQGSSLTNTYGYLGSPSYSAPEQFASTRAMTASGDIWSLGIILYEMVAGATPFESPGDTLAEMATAITYDAPVPMTQRDPSIDPAFERVVLKCLEKDPANRHLRVRELAEALAPFASAPPDDLLARIRRHQPGRADGLSESAPHTSALPAAPAHTSTVPLAAAPLAVGSAPVLPSIPPPPPGNTRYAVAVPTDPQVRPARQSIAVPATLAAMGIVATLAAVAAYRGAHPSAAPAGPSAAALVATAPAVVDPVIPAVASAAPPATVNAAPPASVASTTRPVSSTRGATRGGAHHGSTPTTADSGPKILKDRDGKF